MSHTYLIDLYELIDQRLEKIVEEGNQGRNKEVGEKLLQGRSEILLEFRQFLAGHYNSKLPRRIKNNYLI